jgi:hypothetical protein
MPDLSLGVTAQHLMLFNLIQKLFLLVVGPEHLYSRHVHARMNGCWKLINVGDNSGVILGIIFSIVFWISSLNSSLLWSD